MDKPYSEKTYPRDIFVTLDEGIRKMVDAAYLEGFREGCDYIREEHRQMLETLRAEHKAELDACWEEASDRGYEAGRREADHE